VNGCFSAEGKEERGQRNFSKLDRKRHKKYEQDTQEGNETKKGVKNKISEEM
jgi:hypothetical protein